MLLPVPALVLVVEQALRQTVTHQGVQYGALEGQQLVVPHEVGATAVTCLAAAQVVGCQAALQ